jgi:formylglycine-generating enzyme required for sulfatase activity
LASAWRALRASRRGQHHGACAIQAQYAAFLVDKAGDVSGQDPSCRSNTSYTPCATWPVPDGGDLPVSCVSVCDARAFCAWAGKRLCGALDGGVTPFNEVYGPAVPARTTWYMACTHNADGSHKFPYGNVYDPTACNDGNPDPGSQRLPVGSIPTCEGGFPGLFDMVGNVSEWEDSCEYDDAGILDGCVLRGGKYDSNGLEGQYISCTAMDVLTGTSGWEFLGFRCCSP